MKRFVVFARVRNEEKKFMPLYKEESGKGKYKTWWTANRHIESIRRWYSDLEFKIKEVELDVCPTCNCKLKAQ